MRGDPHAVADVWVTPEPGIGGVLKQRPEDFVVEELPLYEPSGTGEHLYLFVEKRNMTTLELVGHVARHFGVRRRDVGYAGLKDKIAVTRQVLSVWVPGKGPGDFSPFEHERARVLWADMHANKLRRGHLRGNAFSIRVRGVAPAGALPAKRCLDRLAEIGAPNRVGEQRFGVMQNNHVIGAALVQQRWEDALGALLGPSKDFPDKQPEARAAYARGDYAAAFEAISPALRTEFQALRALARGSSPEDAVHTFGESVAGFFLSAFQSAVFNELLDARIRDGLLGELVPGDVAFLHHNRALFGVDDAVSNDPETRDRLESFEISPSGPMWGASMMRASGAIDRAERAALGRTGVTMGDLERFAATSELTMEGARRPYRIPVWKPEVEGGADEHGTYVRCAFELPRGSFATVVMREVMKPAEPGGEGGDHAD